MVQLVPVSEMDAPYDSMTTYLSKEIFIVAISFVFSSIIALLTVISLLLHGLQQHLFETKQDLKISERIP